MKKNIGLVAQFVLCIICVILFIVSMFEKYFFVFAEIAVSLTLFVMAYNNVKTYKRKYFTVVYIIFGLFLLISTLIGMFNGK